MPAWKRQNVLFAVASYWWTLDLEGIEFVPLAVVSRPEDHRIVIGAGGWRALLADNEPLSEKHNRGMMWFEQERVDAVMHLNSDDVITPPYFRQAREALDAGFDAVRLMDYVYYDVQTGRCAHAHPALPGSGTILSRSLLNRMRWKPWQGKGIDRMLDSRLFRRLRETDASVAPISFQPDDDVQLLGFKTEDNMWTYDQILARIKTVTKLDPRDYLTQHFPSFHNAFRQTLFHHAD